MVIMTLRSYYIFASLISGACHSSPFLPCITYEVDVSVAGLLAVVVQRFHVLRDICHGDIAIVISAVKVFFVVDDVMNFGDGASILFFSPPLILARPVSRSWLLRVGPSSRDIWKTFRKGSDIWIEFLLRLPKR